MKLRPLIAVAGLVVLAGALAVPASMAKDTEEELLARLQNEHNPVKRAKYDIRLGEIKLQQAVAAYDQQKMDEGMKLLDAYLERMKDAWEILHSSGRNAAKQSAGFKDLDIALRENMRRLADLAHRLSFYDRGPVEKAKEEIERIRGEVLHSLFPGTRPPSGEKNLAPGISLLETPSLGAWMASWVAPAAQLPLPRQDDLSDEEDSKIRDAQDPSQRIKVYIEITQSRLERVDQWRERSDPNLDVGAYLGKMMGQYVSLTDELKNWIQDQFDRGGDMRSGLRKLLEVGPHQLQQLRHIQETPGPYAADYRKSLGDAIDDLSDTLDGATKALQDQEKKFGELKKEEKAQVQAAKVREKDERKRAKDEKKLRKREQKHRAPTDADDE